MKAKSKKKKSLRTVAKKSAAAGGARPSKAKIEQWNLRLYVAGQTAKSLTALTNLKRICEEHLPGRYHIEVIDLMKQPKLALGDQIVAIPTLVRRLPPPIKRVIGDLSDADRVMVGMDLRPLTTDRNQTKGSGTKDFL